MYAFFSFWPDNRFLLCVKKGCFRLRLTFMTSITKIFINDLFLNFTWCHNLTLFLFSQLFWVFAGFLSLYLAICFYLLPALGSILKVRKRKLAQVTTSSEFVALVSNSSLLELTKQTFNSYSTKFSNLVSSSSDSSSVTTSLTKIWVLLR